MKVLFIQTLKDLQNIHKVFAGFDVSLHEFNDYCRNEKEEYFNYLCID